MSQYDPNKHNRKSIRLKGYDYSSPGLYFVTICVQYRLHLYGKVVQGRMQYSPAGEMINKWYRELENKFADIKCREHIVMPNHFHCIIENIGSPARTGRPTCLPPSVCPSPDPSVCPPDPTGRPKCLPQSVCPKNKDTNPESTQILSEHKASPLYTVIQWFKTMTTNEYIRKVKSDNWPRFNRKLWQRNYWERIILDEEEYRNTANYIINNPIKWYRDRFNSK